MPPPVTPPIEAPPTIPVSVTIIAKNCAESLRECLKSLRKSFLRPDDEVLVLDTGSIDDGATIRAAQAMGARVSQHPELSRNIEEYVRRWLPDQLENYKKSRLVDGVLLDFAEARRICAAEAVNDVQMWIDSDDLFEEETPGQFRAIIDRDFAPGPRQRDSLFLDYQYSFDEDDDGSLSSLLKRERVFDRRKYTWKGKCHETAIPNEGASILGGAYYQDLRAVVRHTRKQVATDRSADVRNYVILRKDYEEQPFKDPRNFFYLGNAARGLRHDAEAIEWYNRLIEASGSRDDRFMAAYYSAIIMFSEENKRPLDAMEHFFRCIQFKPEDPRGYFGLSRAYFQLGRWQECIHWFNIGTHLPEPKNNLHTYNPLQITNLPFQVAAFAFKELGLRAEAVQCVEHLLRHFPKSKQVAEIRDAIGNWCAEQDLIEGVRKVIANARPKSQQATIEVGRRVTAELAQVPSSLEEMGLARAEGPDSRGGRPVSIWCGKAIEPFGPRTDNLGGSEKAVINMAPRLQARGFRVTVYADVPRDQRGLDSKTGVVWQHFGSIDRQRDHGTVIYWRSPAMLEMGLPAERRIVWCHDVLNPRDWTPARIALVDQIWVLSEFHASTLGPVRAALGDKVVITRNGIDSALFRSLAGIERNPKKVIYCSSPDRGVWSAMQLFKAANVEGSELHVFYGFNKLFLKQATTREYCHIPDWGRDVSMYDYMQTVHNAADRVPGLVWHGRVNWETMAREMASAGAWLYPTRFPEISCMAAMEAQAAGLVPVCTRYGALAETVLTNVLDRPIEVSGQEAVARLQEALRIPADAPIRQDLRQEALTRFSYETLADEWIELLKK